MYTYIYIYIYIIIIIIIIICVYTYVCMLEICPPQAKPQEEIKASPQDPEDAGPTTL